MSCQAHSRKILWKPFLKLCHDLGQPVLIILVYAITVYHTFPSSVVYSLKFAKRLILIMNRLFCKSVTSVTASCKANVRHVMGNHALKSLSLSYPKKDWWAGNPSLGMTPTIQFYSAAFTVSYQKKEWWGPACGTFFLVSKTTTRILRHTLRNLKWPRR